MADSTISDKLLARVEADLKRPREIKPRQDEFGNRVSSPSDFAPPDQRPDNVTRALGPLPPYVTHAPQVGRAAAIAAHATVIELETTAQKLEELGRKHYDQAQELIDKVVNSARQIRELAAEVFNEIETQSTINTEVVAGLNDLMARMNLADRIAKRQAAETQPTEPANE